MRVVLVTKRWKAQATASIDHGFFSLHFRKRHNHITIRPPWRGCRFRPSDAGEMLGATHDPVQAFSIRSSHIVRQWRTAVAFC